MSIIRLPNFGGCFVCGHGNARGLNVRFDSDGERVWAHFVAGDEQMGYHGVLHGGVHAALLDECMGWAACVRRGVLCVAGELNIRYSRPGPLHTPLVVRGWVTDDRGRFLECQGEIAEEAGTVFSRGGGKFFPLSRERSVEMIERIGTNTEVPWPLDLKQLFPG